MLVNADNRVFVGHRPDITDEEGNGEWWQMPQGGIDAGEDPARAAFRELQEETSVTSADIIRETSDWLSYDLPDHLLGVSWGGRYRGQQQKWFLMRFEGDDSEIDLSPPGQKAEFDRWQWVPASDLTTLIIPFKRGVYEQLVAEFAPELQLRS